MTIPLASDSLPVEPQPPQEADAHETERSQITLADLGERVSQLSRTIDEHLAGTRR